MKKFLIILLLSIGIVSEGSAKYKYPEGAITRTERKVNRCLARYDSDQDGFLTLEDYENYRMPRTVYERRMERHAKKKGTYVSPLDAFLDMDTDGDGEVTKEELLEYERSLLKK